MAAWHLRGRTIEDGSATPQARSGGGPGEGFLADTRWRNGGWVHGQLQMPEDLLDHLTVRGHYLKYSFNAYYGSFAAVVKG